MSELQIAKLVLNVTSAGLGAFDEISELDGSIRYNMSCSTSGVPVVPGEEIPFLMLKEDTDRISRHNDSSSTEAAVSFKSDHGMLNIIRVVFPCFSQTSAVSVPRSV